MVVGLESAIKYVKQRMGGPPIHYRIVFLEDLTDNLFMGLCFDNLTEDCVLSVRTDKFDDGVFI